MLTLFEFSIDLWNFYNAKKVIENLESYQNLNPCKVFVPSEGFNNNNITLDFIDKILFFISWHLVGFSVLYPNRSFNIYANNSLPTY